MTDVTVVYLVLLVVVLLFVWNRLPVEIVAVGASLALVVQVSSASIRALPASETRR